MLKTLLRMNLPNKLTLLRVILVPVFCAFVCVESYEAQFAAALIFILASLTDMLDGKIARKKGLITDFGKLMDPIADKLLVTAAMVFLTSQNRMNAGMCVAFIAREFIISGFRMLAASRGIVIAAGKLGKYKTVTQMIAIVMAILGTPWENGQSSLSFILPGNMNAIINIAAVALMWIALALAIVSCIEYIVKNLHVIDTTNI